MSVFSDIRQAIETQLVATPGFPAAGQLEFENVAFSPTIGTTWARGQLRPVTQKQWGFGSGGLEIRVGDYLVDLFFPRLLGASAADLLADACRQQFSTPLTLTKNTTSVIIISIDRKPALDEPNWYHVPLIISWQSQSI